MQASQPIDVYAHTHTQIPTHTVSRPPTRARAHRHAHHISHTYTQARAHERRGQREKLTHVLSRTPWRAVENVDNEKPPLVSLSLSFLFSSLTLSLFLSLPLFSSHPLSLHRFLPAASIYAHLLVPPSLHCGQHPAKGISLLHQKSRRIKKMERKKNTYEGTLENPRH